MSTTIQPHEHNINHLLAQLQRIHLLVQYQLRCWQADHAEPPLPFEAEEQQRFEVELEAAQQAIDSILAVGEQQQIYSRLEYLQTVFELDDFELDVFLICLAPLLDVDTEKIYGVLQDDATRTRASVDFIFILLGFTQPQKLIHLPYFQAESPLFKFHLLELEPLTVAQGDGSSLLTRLVWPSATVVAWLLGYYEAPDSLAPHISLTAPNHTPMNALMVGDLGVAWDQVLPTSPLLALYGPDSQRQEAVAHMVAEQTQHGLLTVDLNALSEQNADMGQVISLCLRDALLNRAVPYFKGWEACEVKDILPSALLKVVCATSQLLIIGSRKRWTIKNIERQRRVIMLETPAPLYEHRQQLWSAFVEDCQPQPDLDILSIQFKLTSGQIRDAVAQAQDQASQEGRSLALEDLFAAARILSRPGLSNLAQRIKPRYDWTDIILQPKQIALLKEIVSTVRQRDKVLETWGAGQKLCKSGAVSILFAGPPGTGKTMAAEVLAADLGFDLYKINLSNVVSKYIGETEKNLERIFEEAQNSNTILFFDEADSIFGKRTEVKDAHDRHANTQISYLLQRMESFDGVTILATNLSGNLDEAFTRRLQFVVDIPKPDVALRLQIWQTLFPPQVPLAPDLNLTLLAERFDLTGGHIRNVIVAATYLAADDGQLVTMAHLLHATRREFEKMGRLIDESRMNYKGGSNGV